LHFTDDLRQADSQPATPAPAYFLALFSQLPIYAADAAILAIFAASLKIAYAIAGWL
jgi:hypothetical protein